jgi:hypothetical protein
MRLLATVLLGCSLVSLAGCNGGGSTAAESDGAASGGESSAGYVVNEEPADAMPVGEARAAAENAESVTLVGRIGGSKEPFVDGLAAFTIVDPSVPHCATEEGCPTPWDYCCTQDQVRENIATVKVVDESGSPVVGDARELLGVNELAMVVVSGRASRDDQGNLSVAANEVFVRDERGEDSQ